MTEPEVVETRTSFVRSSDGTRIAYDSQGAGLSVILLHGGSNTRRKWHDIGYVQRLAQEFNVITIDIRGNGDSDRPLDTNAYSIDKHCQDILSVADACETEEFIVWGFSYGGNIGRYLASRSSRVSKFILMGIPFGLGAAGEFRESIDKFRQRWVRLLRESNHFRRRTETRWKHKASR